jgi:aerobic-type carbon monoxide dehydrogenase small subunit (CoxS/CutS family)
MSELKTISFTINGEKKKFQISPDEKLVKLLRRTGYTGAKEGCDEGTCGACTVIMDGKAVLSCITHAFLADGRHLHTIEGLGTFEKPHPIQQALVDEGAVQCGYCTPGLVLSMKALLDENPAPGDDDLRTHLDGNLCRCTGYEKIWIALRKLVAGGGAS